LESIFSATKRKGHLCRKDEVAVYERNKIRAALDKGRQLNHKLQIDVLFDVRFLAKIAIGFGFKILGRKFDDLKYTLKLRRTLWTRRSKLSSEDHELRLKSYCIGLQDFSLKFLRFPAGWVTIVKVIEKDLMLSVVYPSGRSTQIAITDSTTDTEFDCRSISFNDLLFVSIPQLRCTLGPFDLATYLAWQSGSASIPQLDAIRSRFTPRAAMPPLS
jgi:hypothetical protein